MSESEKTVLIVDDENFVRQSLADYFEDCMFRVLQADSGEKALEILEKETPEGVIVDLRMGGMDGHTFVRKALIEKTETAFIFCTGSPDQQIPSDLQKQSYISNRLYRKPVTDMDKLKQELFRIIDLISSKSG